MGRKRRIPREPVEAVIEGFSHEGRGITHVDDKPVFVDGALAGERVRFQYVKRHRRRDDARVLDVLEPSPRRIEPRCPHFGLCGGCSLQHLSPEDQIVHKAGVLAEHLRHIGGVEPGQWLPALTGPVWGYRRRARLGVKYVPAKGDRVLVGFREKMSPFVADIDQCHVLDPRVGERLPELAALIGGLSIRDRVPQIEVALGDDNGGLVFRNLAPWSAADREALVAFGERAGLTVYGQPGNETTITPLSPTAPELRYALPSFGLELTFGPADFTQVNAAINRAMVDRAVALLDPSPNDRVLDLFCGLGNFTLPLASRAGTVIGVEGEAALVERGRENARRNGIDNAVFHVADLSADVSADPWLRGGIDRVLLDPPRSGAAEVLPNVAALGAGRIVYVSCGPATLARDAGRLVHEHGYRLSAAGVMDMFPHTAHVESIAVFDRPGH
ncbi:23S rRNA (uracil(1939)-C(5))-methyltransferase RlmD [Arhodomonas sp. SL1]|uniref:23S rRNA (uracil(1939)-C(5))-methyltransferase RlmD n=1 Tax=Arhodomonas sp. SL1 TaxID=3425691 RepID=UPI003F881559